MARRRHATHHAHCDCFKWEVVIPGWHPTPLNKLLTCHWGKAGRMKKADKAVVFYAFRVLPKTVIPLAKGKRRVHLTIVLGKGQRALDPDNCLKSLGDALVACGALLTDSRQGVEWAPVQFERGEQPATRLLLEDMP